MSDDLNQALSTQSAVRVLRAAFYAPGIDGRAGLPLMLLGDPGVGKSAMVRQFARGLRDKNGDSIACEVLSPGERGDGAFGVTPVPVERGGRHVLVYPVPEWAEPLLAPDAVGLVFVDEIQEAPPHIRAALLGLIHDRRIGGAQLGPNVRVLAAGNDPTTVQSGYGLAANAANRMGHLNWPQPTLAEHGAYMSSLVSAAGGSAAESSERVDEVEALVQKSWPREFARAVGLEFSFHRSNGGARKNMFPGKRNGEAERLRLDPSGAWPSDRCYDEKTDVLTRRGWVRWGDVREDDEFATRDANGMVHYARAVERVSEHYNGEMICFRNKMIDLLVTPNHNMLVSTCRIGGSGGSRRGPVDGAHLVPARDVYDDVRTRDTYAVRIPKTAMWNDQDVAVKRIGSRDVPMTAWAELVGWILTDGYISCPEKKKRYVSVTQVDPVLRRRVAELFQAIGVTTYIAADRVGTPDLDVWRELVKQGRKHDGGRFVPRDIMEAGPAALLALLAGIWGGDGWSCKSGTTFVNVGPNAKLADDVQEAQMRLGGIARVASRQTQKGTEVFEVTLYKNTGKHTAPRLSAKNITKTTYNGMIYCVRVPPHHTLLVRRNGHACWSGNTWELATRALAMSAVLELTPAERTAFVGSFISAPIAAEWLGFIGGTDLPDPVEFLAGKAEFKHSSKRLDRSWALVSACINTLRVKEYATGDNAVALYRFIGEQLINSDLELAQWAWEQMMNPQTSPRNPKTNRMFFLSDLGVTLRYKGRDGVERSLLAILGEACAGTK